MKKQGERVEKALCVTTRIPDSILLPSGDPLRKLATDRDSAAVKTSLTRVVESRRTVCLPQALQNYRITFDLRIGTRGSRRIGGCARRRIFPDLASKSPKLGTHLMALIRHCAQAPDN